MDAKLKTKWVAALRGGAFKQAKGMLKDFEGNYCCLGVLCKVAGLEIDESGDRVVGTDPRSAVAGYFPIYKLIGWKGGTDGRELSMRNDGSRQIGGRVWSFPEIADYIETNL